MESLSPQTLVLAGGGTVGFQYLGVLKKINLDSLKQILGTSVGALLGTALCLKPKIEELTNYFVERDWKTVFKPTGRQILNAYYTKGIYDVQIFNEIFEPLFKKHNLSTKELTLAQLFEFSGIYLRMFTFDLNAFKTVELSYKTFPNMLVVRAVWASCAIPGLIMPVIEEGHCFIDGGVMDNCPTRFCEDTNALVLNVKTDPNLAITEQSTLMDLLVTFTLSAISSFSIINSNMREIVCDMGEGFTLDVLKRGIHDVELRRKWVVDGEKSVASFQDIGKSS